MHSRGVLPLLIMHSIGMQPIYFPLLYSWLYIVYYAFLSIVYISCGMFWLRYFYIFCIIKVKYALIRRAGYPITAFMAFEWSISFSLFFLISLYLCYSVYIMGFKDLSILIIWKYVWSRYYSIWSSPCDIFFS